MLHSSNFRVVLEAGEEIKVGFVVVRRGVPVKTGRENGRTKSKVPSRSW